MGLRERRLVNIVQTEALPQTESDLNSVVGAPVAWNIDWNSFTVDEISAGNLQHQGLGRVYSALRSVARDEIGKEAIREKIKQVHIANSKEHPKAVTLKDGVLDIVAWWGSDESESYFQDSEIERIIEDLV